MESIIVTNRYLIKLRNKNELMLVKYRDNNENHDNEILQENGDDKHDGTTRFQSYVSQIISLSAS